jgi:hypothetical protein
MLALPFCPHFLHAVCQVLRIEMKSRLWPQEAHTHTKVTDIGWLLQDYGEVLGNVNTVSWNPAKKGQNDWEGCPAFRKLTECE